MNKLYAQRNGIPVDNTKQTNATRAVEKMIERDRQNRERSAQILDYYKGNVSGKTRNKHMGGGF